MLTRAVSASAREGDERTAQSRLVRVGVPRMLVRLLDSSHRQRVAGRNAAVGTVESPVLRHCLLLGNAMLQDG